MVGFSPQKPCRILSLDGGGAKGFYRLGVLREIEGMVKCRLHQKSSVFVSSLWLLRISGDPIRLDDPTRSLEDRTLTTRPRRWGDQSAWNDSVPHTRR